MVTSELLKNKEGKLLKTKEGKDLVDYRLESGDEFIPQINKVLEYTREVDVKGKLQQITNYKLNAIVKGFEEETPIFLTLTPTQAKTLQKKQDEGVILVKNVFTAYTYTSEKYGEQIGVGLKPKFHEPLKTFDEVEE